MSALLALVSFDLCPYVQRAAIVLAEKGVAFERIDVDLANKPDWFKGLSPLGKVPLLKAGEQVLFESAPIVEYLEEIHGPPLHPTDPLAKARHRGWMEFGSSILSDIWTLETTHDRQAFDAKVRALRDKFGRIETELGPGPYFAGERFCIVDAVFAPVFRYFDVFDDFADLGMFAETPRLRAWRQALAGRPSVKGAVVADYPDRLRAFLNRHAGVITQLSSAA